MKKVVIFILFLALLGDTMADAIVYGPARVKRPEQQNSPEEQYAMYVRYGKYIDAYKFCRNRLQKDHNACVELKDRVFHAIFDRLNQVSVRIYSEQSKELFENIKEKTESGVASSCGTTIIINRDGSRKVLLSPGTAFQSNRDLHATSPNSTFSCLTGSGVLYTAGSADTYRGWELIQSVIDYGDHSEEFNYAARLIKEYTHDGYCVFSYPADGNVEFTDVSLPISFNIKQILAGLGDQSYEVGNRGAIAVLNNIYKNTVFIHEDEKEGVLGIASFCYQLLINARFREEILDTARQMYGYDAFLREQK